MKIHENVLYVVLEDSDCTADPRIPIEEILFQDFQVPDLSKIYMAEIVIANLKRGTKIMKNRYGRID